MKKTLSICILLALCLCTVIPFAACNTTTAETKVMTMQLNPQIEFIIDTDNKIVSVNALNEDGNLILAAQTDGKKFVGQTADKAAELYVDYCEELGFFVKGTAKDGENQLTISFSGKQAEQDIKDMATKVDAYIKDTYDTISASVVNGVKIADEYLQAQLKKAMPYLTDAALEGMNLVEELAAARQETAEMYSQAIKDAYYSAKSAALNQARFDAVKENANTIQQIALEGALVGYNTATSVIEKTRNALLIDDNSVYQLALKAFQKAKTEYLNYRNYLRENNIDEGADYTAIEKAYTDAKVALESAYDKVEAQLKSFQETLDNAYATVVDTITKAGLDFNAAVDNAQVSINAKLDKFESDFATQYQASIDNAKADWTAMKDKLEQGYQAEANN